MRPARLSVVIPARNEERALPACLGALRGQPGGAAVEILVVDHRSDDRTAAIARAFGARVLGGDGPIGALRQAGVDASGGGVIASTDADTIVSGRWIEVIEARFRAAPELVALSGPVEFAVARPARLAGRAVWESLRLAHAVARRPVVLGANFAVRRGALEAAGGFDPTLASAEDVDVARRLRARGPVRYERAMAVRTSARRVRHEGLAHFALRQLFNYYLLCWHRAPLPLQRVD